MDDAIVSAGPPTAAPIGEALSGGPMAAPASKATLVQVVLVLLGVIAFLYFARPVVLPVVLACIAAMTLKPVVRGLARWHIPPALSLRSCFVSWWPPSASVFFN